MHSLVEILSLSRDDINTKFVYRYVFKLGVNFNILTTLQFQWLKVRGLDYNTLITYL